MLGFFLGKLGKVSVFTPNTAQGLRVYIYVFYHLIDKNGGFTVIIVLYLFRNVGMDISGNGHCKFWKKYISNLIKKI